MRRYILTAALFLLGGLMFADSANAGLFNRRARAYEASGCYGYSAGYGAACYGQSYEAYGASCYGQSYAAPARPVRRLLGGLFTPRRAAYISAPSVNATYYYSAPAPASGYMGGYSGSTPFYYGDSYINPGGANYPPSWQARCPGGVCPMPQTPGKQTPTPVPPAPLPPPAPPPKHDQHAGGKCDCGDPKCTHGVGVCECTNPACTCPEHKYRRRGFPR